MKSRTASSFWRCFESLPRQVQRDAEQAYELWRDRPYHRSLYFKRVRGASGFYSIRIGTGWRALGEELDPGVITWFWIGSHGEYDNLLRRR